MVETRRAIHSTYNMGLWKAIRGPEHGMRYRAVCEGPVWRHGACHHAGFSLPSVQCERAGDTLSLPPPPIQHITGSVNVGVGHDRSNFCRISVEEGCNPALCFPDSHRGSPGLGFILIQQVNEP